MHRFFIAIFGLVLIVIAITGLLTGEISGWGPLGVGPSRVSNTGSPIYFWVTVCGDFTFGTYIIYRMLADKE